MVQNVDEYNEQRADIKTKIDLMNQVGWVQIGDSISDDSFKIDKVE